MAQSMLTNYFTFVKSNQDYKNFKKISNKMIIETKNEDEPKNLHKYFPKKNNSHSNSKKNQMFKGINNFKNGNISNFFNSNKNNNLKLKKKKGMKKY